MSRIAVALPAAIEHRLVPEAARWGHTIVLVCTSSAELVARIPGSGVDLVVVGGAEETLDEALVAACDAAGVRLVVLAGAHDTRRLRSVGLLDPVPDDAGWDRIAGVGAAGVAPRAVASSPTSAGLGPPDGTVGRPRSRRREPAAAAREGADAVAASAPPVSAPLVSPRRGEVIVVWGPSGAPGRTTTAIAIASELAAAGLSVCLADADTHAASVAPALGLLDESPGFAAACRLAGAGALDTAEFERIAQTVRTRQGAFRVLTGLGLPRRWPELSADRVTATLRVARRWVDAVVVDVASPVEEDEEISSDVLAPRRNAATIAALAEADRVVVVGAADPVGLSRLLRAHAELLETTDADRVSVLVGKVRASAIGMNPAGQIRQTLLRFAGIDDATLVPHDQPAFDAAILSGRVLADVAPLSPARAALRDLALTRLGCAPLVDPANGAPRGARRTVGRGPVRRGRGRGAVPVDG